ncbi:unnamed protein product [Pseudo-nitzschia multistriata]|uniref:Uncharacterized protein n=1 Tax=Pseudo-nitzschia multistriata TaxID=183589 RepID=A0A448ZL82_9STRA|nr:unnamed protein product [Pseudo-nitzschia multistriata]
MRNGQRKWKSNQKCDAADIKIYDLWSCNCQKPLCPADSSSDSCSSTRVHPSAMLEAVSSQFEAWSWSELSSSYCNEVCEVFSKFWAVGSNGAVRSSFPSTDSWCLVLSLLISLLSLCNLVFSAVATGQKLIIMPKQAVINITKPIRKRPNVVRRCTAPTMGSPWAWL